MLVGFVGGAGSAILFVCLLVMVGIVSLFVLTYAGHCFLVVVQDTAAGIDEVIWPDEPPQDWLGRAVSLGWLIFLWLVPLGLILRIVKPAFLQQQPALAVLLGGVVLWIGFPIGVLSSLSATARWVFFRPKILLGLARLRLATLGFYLLSAGLIACALMLWYVALADEPLLIPLASGIGAAVLLIYARLLGRIAWMLSRLKPLQTVKKRRQTRSKHEDPEVEGIVVQDPWAVPAEPKRRKRVKSPPQQEEVYGLAEQESPATSGELPLDGYYPVGEEPPESQENDETPAAEPAQEEPARQQTRPSRPRKPCYPLLSGVFTFPWYEKSLRPWLYLSLGGSLAGGLLQVMLSHMPG